MAEKAVKKIPQRRCCGCGERFDKRDLVRVVRSPAGEIALDTTGKMPGRGAYLCCRAACLQKARRAKRLEQNLACSIPDEVYAALEKGIEPHE